MTLNMCANAIWNFFFRFISINTVESGYLAHALIEITAKFYAIDLIELGIDDCVK